MTHFQKPDCKVDTRWMYTFITITKTHDVNPAQGKIVLPQWTQMFDKHVPPPCRKRQGPSRDPPLRVHFRYLPLSPTPPNQDNSRKIFWFQDSGISKYQKSHPGGSAEDVGDTVKRSCVGRARWWAHWRVCRAEKHNRNSESGTHCVYFYGAVSS